MGISSWRRPPEERCCNSKRTFGSCWLTSTEVYYTRTRVVVPHGLPPSVDVIRNSGLVPHNLPYVPACLAPFLRPDDQGASRDEQMGVQTSSSAIHQSRSQVVDGDNSLAHVTKLNAKSACWTSQHPFRVLVILVSGMNDGQPFRELDPLLVPVCIYVNICVCVDRYCLKPECLVWMRI